MKRSSEIIGLLALFAVAALAAVFISTGHLSPRNLAYLVATAAIAYRRLIANGKTKVVAPSEPTPKRGILYKAAAAILLTASLLFFAVVVVAFHSR
jgi:hypothetical protein